MDFISMLFDSVWKLYCIKWPGFPFTVGQAVIGVLLAVFGLTILSKLTGFSFTVPDIFRPAEQKGGNNKRVRIDKRRQGDDR